MQELNRDIQAYLALEEQGKAERNFLEALAKKIEEELEQRPEFFLNQCYRLDINERALQDALQTNARERGLELAQLFLQREREKAALRRLYAQKKEEDEEISPW